MSQNIVFLKAICFANRKLNFILLMPSNETLQGQSRPEPFRRGRESVLQNYGLDFAQGEHAVKESKGQPSFLQNQVLNFGEGQ